MSSAIATYLFAIAVCIASPLAMLSGLAMAPLVAVVGFIPLLWLVKERKRTDLRSPAFLWIRLFFYYALLSTLWTINAYGALRLWSELAVLVIMGMAAFVLFPIRLNMPATILGRILLLSMFLSVLLAFAEIISAGVISSYFRSIVSGNTEEYAQFHLHYLNRGACVLALLLWPALLAVVNNGKNTQSIALAVVLWLAVGGLLTQLESLSALLGFVGGSVACALVMMLRNYAMYVIIAGLVGITVSVPVFFTAVPPEKIISSVPLPESARHRVYIWHFAGHKALEKPWLGWGMNSSRDIPGGNMQVLPNVEAWKNLQHLPLHPHNSIIQLWLEIGIAGLVLWVMVIILVIQRIMKEKFLLKEKALCMALLVCYLSIGFVGFGFWQHWWVASIIFSGVVMRMLTGSARQS